MRSDAQLRRDVEAELDWEPAVNPAHIGVIAADGIVTLTGHVSSYAEKRAAEGAARRVKGVKALAVEMTVKLPVSDQRSDADIAMAAERGLEWSVLVPAGKIKPMVENGWITLHGEAEWDYQRRAAERAVRNLMGVTGVTNEIKLIPKVKAVDVEKRLHDALSRQANREADRIQVTVEGSEVHLKGKVHSWAELDAVQGAAWSAPGVRSVVNELTID